MTLTLDFGTLYGIVERSLSVIGKRSIDDKGNLLFKDITLGSREKEIINDYFKEAAVAISAATVGFISSYTDQQIVLSLPGNHPQTFDTAAQTACQNYCVAWALYSWFTVTAPQIAGKYLISANACLEQIVQIIYYKQPPSSGQ